MSLHFIVDGYNVMRRSGAFETGSLETQRQAFLGWIESARPQGSVQNGVTVVFDGQEGGGIFETPGGTRVVFTSGTSADERIKEMVEAAPGPRNIVVVSDDKEIVCYVRRLGARPMKARDFMRASLERRTRRTDPQASEAAEVELGAVERESITEEVRRIWLRKK